MVTPLFLQKIDCFLDSFIHPFGIGGLHREIDFVIFGLGFHPLVDFLRLPIIGDGDRGKRTFTRHLEGFGESRRE